ncbi:MAG TPA: lanthionine synthetase LanC family protein, partial [Kofleriaceae bacterium]|nr:lanthionine synthetase LanC family protein [Kofleriaceae bacterium]
CYQDLGASIALLSAARAADNPSWHAEALALARACASRTDAQAQIRDAGLCHGALGAAHLFDRLWQATGDQEFERAARHWLDRGLALRSDRPIAGFPASSIEDGVESWIADPSLLSGASGVALVLHSMITSVEPGWDQLLLVDLEPIDLEPVEPGLESTATTG